MHAFFALLLVITQPWLLVSDIHVDPYNHRSQPAWYQSDTNWPLFDASIAQMRARAPHPAVVVITGDFLTHHFLDKVRLSGKKESTEAVALRTMRRVEQAFAAAFPDAQFLITLGNNDDPCGDYRTAPRTAYLASLARMWAPLVNRRNAAPHFVHDFTQFGSYTASLPGGARAVVLDDVYWSFVYRGCKNAPWNAPQLQMQWLAAALAGLPHGARAAVVMHIPPGVDPMTTLMTKRFLVVPYWSSPVLGRFTALMREYRERTGVVLAGHAHRADFREAGGVPVLVAPAISPIYLNNPGFAVLHVAGAQLQDYDLYAMDLYSGDWARIFNFRAVYGVNTFDGAALVQAHDAIGAQPDVRSRWVSALGGGAEQADVDIGRDWRAYWCAQTELAGGYAGCAGDRNRVALGRAAVMAAALLVLAALLWGILRIVRQRRGA